MSMRRHSWFLFTPLALSAGLLPPGLPQEGPPKAAPSSSQETKLVQAIVAARDAFWAAEGYRELFESAKADDLRRLKTHTSDTIAIQAAWEEVERTVPKDPAETVRPERTAL